MAFSVTFRSAPIGFETSATTVAVNATTVATGELIILCAKVEGSPGTMTWSSSNGSDVVVTRPFFSHTNGDLHICFGYILASVGTGTVTYTCTCANSVPFRSAHARRATYTTCEFADDSYAVEDGSSNCNSGDVTATGVSFAVGLYGEYSTTDTGTEQIDGQTADGEIHNAGVVSNYTSSWDEAFAAGWTGAATATVGNTNVCGVIAFQETAGGGGISPGVLAAYFKMIGTH